MNRIFNIIWSKSKERWIVVSEKVKSNGRVPKSLLLTFSMLSAMIAAGVPLYALDSGALPTGGEVTSGNATIVTSGHQMTINQSSQSMIADWQSFNIGSDAAVRFNQPNSLSTALNRINDQNPTQIMGSLSANGKIFLINPSGILFGRDARVDVGGLVASSLDMLDRDFLDGKYSFQNSGNAGAILNQGTINAFQGGVVALIAPRVTNEGAITTPGGSTVLGAGNQVSLDFNGDGLINLTVDAGAVEALAENNGIIKAEGGLVMMTAKAADALIQSAVNNSGIIEANSFQQRDGRIILDAIDGMTTISGTLDVSSSGSRGGQIVATGDRVLVTSGAHLTASGATGGGEVLVGGSWQGKDSSIHQATGTIVESGALLEANATDYGNGGTVVAWSDVSNPHSVTRAYGTFEAQGGLNGGDGGRIETSGHWIDVAGITINTAALAGNAGLWLLDPYNITISDGPASGTSYNNSFTALETSVILASTVGSALALNNVTINTGNTGIIDAGDITVSSSISRTSGSLRRTLMLNAAGSIIINAAISNNSTDNGALLLTMNAGSTISGNGAIGGTSTGGITATFNVGSSDSNKIYSGIISNATGLTKTGTGTLILSGANTYTGLTTVTAGTLQASNATALGTTDRGVTVTSGATLEINNVAIGAEALTLDGIGVSGIGGLVGTGTASYAGSVTLGSITPSIGGSGTLTISGRIVDGTGSTLTKVGTGSLILSNSNFYTGTTTISKGTLSLGFQSGATFTPLGTVGGGTIVNDGATLDLNGFTLTSDEALTLYGTGAGSAGALTNSSATEVTYKGLITLGSDSSIIASSGSITLANTGTITGAYGLTLGGIASDSKVYSIIGTATGTVTKVGTGTWKIIGANTYTGLTTISAGTLRADNALALGTVAGGVTVTSGGTLEINNLEIGAEALTLDGTGVGGLGGLTGIGAGALYQGTVKLGANTPSVGGYLNISGVISDGTGSTLTKVGTGLVRLHGANTYTGLTTVSTGILRASNAKSLGSTAAGVIVTSGATLEINGVAIEAEPLMLDGSGFGGLGGLVGISTASYAGTVKLGSTSPTIGVRESATFTVSGIISDDAGNTLTKVGTGVLILSGANTYTGATTISAGTLKATNSTALGSVDGGVTVTSGAVLELSGGIAIGAEALSLSGSGISSCGALLNTSEDNSYGGTVTLLDGTQINSESGILTLSGTINGNFGLSVNGSGSVTLGGTIGDSDPLESFVSNAATTLVINGGSIVTTGLQTYSGPTTFGAATTLTTTDSDITATGAVTATAGTLTFASGSGDVMFSTVSNDFSTVKVISAGDVSIIDKNKLTVSGITSTGLINVATLTGDLTLSGDVSTTYTPEVTLIATPPSIIFNAGQNADAGTADGGDIIVSGTSTITVEEGVIAALYTGSVSKSTGLTALIKSGSGKFRYNSDESAKKYTTELSEGLNAIYRKQPAITVTGTSETITYGEDPALESNAIGVQNGDTPEQIFSESVNVTVDGPKSSSDHYTAGEHTLTPSEPASLLGYALSYSTDGKLTVKAKPVTVSGITASDKSYDGNKSATINYESAIITGIVNGDELSVSALGEFIDPDVGTGKIVTLSSSYDGADIKNYDITDQATTTASILDAPPVVFKIEQPPVTLSPEVIVEYVVPSTSLNSGLIVVTIPQGVVALGGTFSFPLPAEVQQVIAETVASEAIFTLEGDLPMPDWLHYDSIAKIFIVDGAPAGSFPVKVLLRVGDKSWTVQISS